MFNIRIRLLKYRILGLVKKKLVSRPDFFKLEGGHYYKLFMNFWVFVSKMAAMS